MYGDGSSSSDRPLDISHSLRRAETPGAAGGSQPHEADRGRRSARRCALPGSADKWLKAGALWVAKSMGMTFGLHAVSSAAADCSAEPDIPHVGSREKGGRQWADATSWIAGPTEGC